MLRSTEVEEYWVQRRCTLGRMAPTHKIQRASLVHRTPQHATSQSGYVSHTRSIHCPPFPIHCLKPITFPFTSCRNASVQTCKSSSQSRSDASTRSLAQRKKSPTHAYLVPQGVSCAHQSSSSKPVASPFPFGARTDSHPPVRAC